MSNFDDAAAQATILHGIERLGDLLHELKAILVDAREFVDVCASGGVGNTDDQWEAEARAVLRRIDDVLSRG